ncbi:MAG: FAD-dependent oxidoreductase [Oscillospiraceae bacterium]|nr:FAD-dependent oxidoreductase [Oscillospiraceae bacterium]
MAKYIIEQEQQIPVYAEADVLVVGAGPAGYCAAVAAARSGAKTILMERYGYLGGMATGGYVLLFDCLDDGKGSVVIKGLVEETLDRLEKLDGLIGPEKEIWGSSEMKDILKWRQWCGTGGEDKIVRNSPVVDPELLKCVANDMCLESGVQLLLHAWFSKAYMEGDTVKGAIFESKSGRQAVLAKVTIDATGDGDVFATAGENFTEGHLPLGLIFRVGNVDTDAAEAYLADTKNSDKIVEELKKAGGLTGGYSFGDLPHGFFVRSSISNIVWFNNTTKGSAINVDDLIRVEIDTRKAMLRTVDYFKENVPGFEKAVIVDTAPQIGTRSSRMVEGEHTITRAELNACCSYEDTVVVVQPPYHKFEPEHELKQIPYRCFVPKKVENLLVAGRCISGDFGAIEMLRVIPTVMLMGQACGVAAAMAVQGDVAPRKVDVKALQDALRGQNVYLP